MGDPPPKKSFGRTLRGLFTPVTSLVTFLAAVVAILGFLGIRGLGERGEQSPNTLSLYYTTDGDRPDASPICDGLFTLCLGQPIERALELLGSEDERVPDMNGIVRLWELEELRLVIGANEAGAIDSLSASMPPHPRPRLAIPHGLVMGEARMGDVVASLGPPRDKRVHQHLPIVSYDLIYCVGPEGSHQLTFSYDTESGGLEDPGSVNAVGKYPLTTFSVELGCSL